MPPRTIWVIRHGERVDNVDKKWKEKNAERKDDPEMTIRGKQQAHEVGKFFANRNIEKIICSPYTRCIETAAQIVAVMENKPMICIENGFMESLNGCTDPPGFPTMEKIKEYSTKIDDSYKPVYEKCPPEIGGDLGCGERVTKTFKEVCKKFPDGDIMIISHGSPIANLHAFLVGHWKYVGQATISKITDNFGNYKLDYYNKKDHLSQPYNLHDDENTLPTIK